MKKASEAIVEGEIVSVDERPRASVPQATRAPQAQQPQRQPQWNTTVPLRQTMPLVAPPARVHLSLGDSVSLALPGGLGGLGVAAAALVTWKYVLPEVLPKLVRMIHEATAPTPRRRSRKIKLSTGVK